MKRLRDGTELATALADVHRMNTEDAKEKKAGEAQVTIRGAEGLTQKSPLYRALCIGSPYKGPSRRTPFIGSPPKGPLQKAVISLHPSS